MKNIKKNFSKINIIKRISLVGFLIFSLIIVTDLKRELARRSQIKKDIAEIEKQISQIELDNEKMKELIIYLKSSEFLEREARVKLGLAKEGEEAIIFSNQGQHNIDKNNNDDRRDKKFNIEKKGWFTYFFGK